MMSCVSRSLSLIGKLKWQYPRSCSPSSFQPLRTTSRTPSSSNWPCAVDACWCQLQNIGKKDKTIMWIEVKDGTSDKAKDDTFWENIVTSISKKLDCEFRQKPVKVMLSGQSMTEGIGAHACVRPGHSHTVKCVNMVSLYIQNIDATRHKRAIHIATSILKENLEGETYIKITYRANKIEENIVIDSMDE